MCGDPSADRVYKTPNRSGTQDVAAGDYTIHNALLVGTELLASWYTDGIRIIDIADPSSPRGTNLIYAHELGALDPARVD